MKYIIKLLYKRYPDLFQEVMVEDFVGDIPQKVAEPANEFLSTAGRKWEAWLLWVSWILQRKSVSEPARSEFYFGMQSMVKMLLILAVKKASPKLTVSAKVETKEEENPFSGVEEFIKGFKK